MSYVLRRIRDILKMKSRGIKIERKPALQGRRTGFARFRGILVMSLV
jgi:hypothetical protein